MITSLKKVIVILDRVVHNLYKLEIMKARS
jgi:hypothetical protein